MTSFLTQKKRKKSATFVARDKRTMINENECVRVASCYLGGDKEKERNQLIRNSPTERWTDRWIKKSFRHVDGQARSFTDYTDFNVLK